MRGTETEITIAEFNVACRLYTKQNGNTGGNTGGVGVGTGLTNTKKDIGILDFGDGVVDDGVDFDPKRLFSKYR